MKKILPIFLNEGRLYFYSWLGWGFFIIINIIATIGFLFGTVRYGKFEELFRLLEMPFAWGVLIVGTRSLGRDKELGLFPLYFTAPIKLDHFIIAKYLSLITVFVIIALSVMIYPIIASLFFVISWKTVFSGLTGLILIISLFSSVSLLASSFSNNALIAIIIGFGIWMIFSLIGSLANMFDPNMMISGILREVSYASHFNNIISGVFSLEDIIYFITIPIFLLKITESQLLIQTAK